MSPKEAWMLTIETKRHIDSARQVLVGKVPDPKAQIDQITNALIFKFMDDMDVKAKDAGGKASFFTGDLEPYAWRKLMDPRKGAQERLNMYTEALEKFSTAASLPLLFRDIFRQAFLPYRDPETLNLFLKEIEFFDYNHSEELGNAFEYLLSIMGSQGDAGQFRTPRHIIDFIVDIIDPDYNDTILDPACGTAGFLISAYKHIVKKHDGVGVRDKKNSEKSLTHQQKQKLMDNLEGYDVSSDMVKLARVNMYLHGNKNPKIFEYDSLGNEDKWDDMFDVMLANPPFMSPKGGVRPHKKFGVESSRSEVLFVDYIMSHLKQNGRAGIIVPEGIIFQSGKAHKQLRKALVEDGLMAVVSLPAGVFNPYSGVKTSILIFDNNRTKKSDKLVFATAKNDGFDLGAQRRPTPYKNDLPTIADILKKYRQGELVTQEQIDDYLESEAALRNPGQFSEVTGVVLVERSKIVESGDYNLSASRYAVAETNQNQKWPRVRLGDERYFHIESGGTPDSKDEIYWNGDVNWATLVDLPAENFITSLSSTTRKITEKGLKKSSAKLLPKGTVLISSRATIGRIAIATEPTATNQGFKNIVIKSDQVLPDYVAYAVTGLIERLKDMATGGTFAEFSKTALATLEIPLPPIEAQKQIASELDGYQRIINSAKEMYQARGLRLTINPLWPTSRLADVCSVGSSKRIFQADYVVSGVPFYRTKEIAELEADINPSTELFIDKKKFDGIKGRYGAPSVDDILVSAVGTIGKVWRVPQNYPEFYFKDGNLLWLKNVNKTVQPEFLELALRACIKNNIMVLKAGAAYEALTIVKLKELSIPIPPLDEQKKLVEEHEKIKRMLVDQNLEIIEFFEQKIKDKIAEVWGE
jgi:type I restriction enzyme M protein